ncbi:MAG: TIGR02186 family protein [Paracoccaceae bacterium]
MKWYLPALAGFIGLAAPLWAQEQVVAGISQDRIEINANFDGSDLLIYGAVKRETPIPADSQLEVIVTVEGPSDVEVVRRKSSYLGLWINSQTVSVDSAPSFYSVAASGRFEDVISNTEDLRHGISLRQVIRFIGAPAHVENAQDFKEALIRLRTAEGVYSNHDNSVQVSQQTLFRTTVDLPANLVEGNYKTRIYLLRNRAVVGLYQKAIFVRKVGLERWLFRLAHNDPAYYGILALAVAALSGWAASALFGLLRR